MSIYGMMRTGVSGMAAQANKLSTVADNIANSGTTGYKRSQTQFSSLLMPNEGGIYNSGGVTTNVRTAVSDPGALQYTTSNTDLAISGEGFFVVKDASGQPVLTRAGSFVPDGDGNLVNAAGYQLMGYSTANGAPSVTANGYAGLEGVSIRQSGMTASPSRDGYLSTNLPEEATAVAAADLPSANAGSADYTSKTSLVTYDNVGSQQLLDVYYTKTGANTWEVSVFDRSKAAPDTSFPYTSGPLATQTLSFDPTTGQLDPASATKITVPVPNGASLDIDLGSTTELAADFTIGDVGVDGSAANTIDSVEISNDGTVYAQYGDGTFKALYRVPLATVQSPDQLQALSGNVFAATADSGDVRLGFSGQAGVGDIVTSAVENSNVDIAEELTSMIEAQRSYGANSKTFMTGSEVMDVLINLKR